MLDPTVIARINHPKIADYFSRNPHRIAAFRATLDLLAIDLPEWAERDMSGRAAANRDALAAYRADNPETLHEATMRKSREHATRRIND